MVSTSPPNGGGTADGGTADGGDLKSSSDPPNAEPDSTAAATSLQPNGYPVAPLLPGADPLDPQGCNFINDYCNSSHGGGLLCSWLREKGRILTADRDYALGEVLFQEPPLHIVSENKEAKGLVQIQTISNDSPLDYESLWYWCAIQSMTEDDLVGAIQIV